MIIESTYIAIQTSIYIFFLYPMMGLGWTVAKFLWFYYYLLMSFIAFTLSGMATMALTPAPQISAVLIYFFICLWNLFSGFIIPRPVYHSLLPSFFKSIIIGSKLWNRFKTIKLCFKGITYFLNLFQRTIW